jgi:hypothetical protein
MMLVTRKKLDRRTFLRGTGAALALPFLDGMVPAFAGPENSLVKPVRRLSVAYVPNGIIMGKWTPSAEGARFELPAILQPLAPFRDQLLVLTGLRSQPAFPEPGEGTGDHARAAATFLTGVHPKKTEGPDIRAGISMDQIAARELGKETQLSSLEMCLDSSELLGGCDAGYSCAYANTLAWRNPTTALPMENQPRAVFERLFGDNDDTSRAGRLKRIEEDRSILDSLLQGVANLEKSLGPGDRGKLTQYLDAIRDLERRIQKAEQQSAKELPPMERPAGGIPATFAEHARIMFDLQVLAFQADLTRVSTFMISREISPRPYPEIGISDAHHALTHEANPGAVEKVIKINTYHMQQFAYFLEKLRSTPDGDGTLLDHIAIVYGAGISNGFEHTHTNLPVLVVGGGSGQLKGGRHLKYAEDTPLANLHLTLLGKLGVPMDALGDSSGQLPQLSGV